MTGAIRSCLRKICFSEKEVAMWEEFLRQFAAVGVCGVLLLLLLLQLSFGKHERDWWS